MNNQELVDFGTHPQIFADGLASALVSGPNVMLTFTQWRLVGGLVRPVITLDLIRPINTLIMPAYVLANAVHADDVVSATH